MPHAEINVPGLILVGRFWVTPEELPLHASGALNDDEAGVTMANRNQQIWPFR